MPLSRFAEAVIVHANYAQFGPGQRVLNPHVKSRMILWCKAGTGVVVVNGVSCPLQAGGYLLLPWGHSVQYRASKEDPFFVAGIHLIPRHSTNRPITFAVAHHDQHPLAHVSFRKDIKIAEIDGLKLGWFNGNPPITYLLEYIVGLFIRGLPPEWLARQLAQEVLYELVLFERRHEIHDHAMPLELERMKQFILFNIRRTLSLRDLVEFSNLSPSTVGRMFREYLNTTPVSWILRMKMERAQVLLRTRRLSVSQVGGQVGISNPYYFSKCFKKATGRSPQEYRKETAWI